MILHSETVPTVVIFGRDTVVGRALELLLQSADYNVRFVSELSLNDPGLLDEPQLMLLTPGLDAECYEELSALIDSKSSSAMLPIMELVNDDQEARVEADNFVVPWPCRAEELKRRIKSALLTRSGKAQDGDYLILEKGKKAVVGG